MPVLRPTAEAASMRYWSRTPGLTMVPSAIEAGTLNCRKSIAPRQCPAVSTRSRSISQPVQPTGTIRPTRGLLLAVRSSVPPQMLSCWAPRGLSAPPAGRKRSGRGPYENAVNFPALGAEGVEVRQFPADVVSAMARASEELIQEIASKGSFERQVYESFMTYRNAANAYAQVADLAQLQVRASVVK